MRGAMHIKNMAGKKSKDGLFFKKTLKENEWNRVKEKHQNYVNEHINLGKLALICFQE